MSTITAESSAKRFDIRKLTMIALFTALGFICTAMFHFIQVQFLTLDFKDVFIALAGFVYGPAAALFTAFADAVLEFVTISDTGIWGALMNFASSAAFAVTASLIYKYNRTFIGAVVGLVSSVFAMTAVMMLMNLLITPIYMHVTVSQVKGMIMPLLLPFNLLKALLNASMTFILYKPLTQALKAMRVMPASENSFAVSKRSVIGFIIAALVIAGSVALLMIPLGGSFGFMQN